MTGTGMNMMTMSVKMSVAAKTASTLRVSMHCSKKTKIGAQL